MVCAVTGLRMAEITSRSKFEYNHLRVLENTVHLGAENDLLTVLSVGKG